MSVGLAVRPAAEIWEDDIGDELPYLWSDLLARRNALALLIEDIVPLLRVDEQKYRARERGDLTVGPYLAEELVAMQDFVAGETAGLLAAAPATGPVTLHAIEDQDQFHRRHPDARTRRDEVPYPVTLHYVAVGRAAGELSRLDRDVEVHRGAKRADLMVRRLAAGLLKNEAAALLGVEKKHYYAWERGAKPPSAGLLAEYQAVDDLITATAAQLTVSDADGVTVVHMLDDQQQFELAYPLAKTLRDGTRYPLRVHRVAAARRAEQVEAAGGSSRIAVLDK